MAGGTLIIEWGKNTKSGISMERGNLTIGLGKRKKLNPTELKKCREFRPKKAILLSKQDGGLARSRLILYVSDWRVSFDTKRMYWIDGKFDAGRRMENMLPYEVPVSHFHVLGQIGRELFDLSRFHGIRLYGDRHIDSGESVHIATFKSEKGKEVKQVFAEPRDARIAEAFSKVNDDEPAFSLSSIEEMTPRDARWLLDDEVSGPTELIDLARANSLFMKHRIRELEEDIKRGEGAKKILTVVKMVSD